MPDDAIEKFHSCQDSLWWHGCYSQDSRFSQYVTPESFAHPAKMAWGLADRIFKHLKQLELLNKGDVVCDFMSGSGRTGIMSSLHGHDFIGVELEPHFIKMINDNKNLLERKIGRKVNWQIIQGDSRKLSEILQQNNLVGITSPPYSNVNQSEKEGLGHNKECECNFCQKTLRTWDVLLQRNILPTPSTSATSKMAHLWE